MGEKVLVTGGAGYIGSHTVKKLGEAGYDLVIYDNLSTGLPDAILYGELVVGEMNDFQLLSRVFAQHQFDAVLHFAASISVPESLQKPLAYYANNTCNTLNLLRCCQQFGVNKLVFSSTAAVYGATQEFPVKESSPTLPVNPYGRSKLMSEMILQDYSLVSDLKYVILRYFNVAGADSSGKIGQSGKASHLIKLACDAALGLRGNLSIFGTDYPTHDGTGVRDYIHVEDLASAHISALSYLKTNAENQILNCGYGKGYSVREVLEKVKEISGVDFPIVETSRRKGDPACVVASADKIRQVLGWQPEYDSLDTIIRSALLWEQKNLVDC
ncbi:MAG: UDP-glucose 4-epimerase GalE [Xenococcaceae cyanobacterium MO_207.B15]|nr:UDP-glucose 4-epimerase GalE [Xenococcaceae cyanobacterium MO_207.B15]MDJ0745898.1 UDP-glucose 4-epimerase GalE [Xenococcaceae cyanobacterium MO_167.B27]